MIGRSEGGPRRGLDRPVMGREGGRSTMITVAHQSRLRRPVHVGLTFRSADKEREPSRRSSISYHARNRRSGTRASGFSPKSFPRRRRDGRARSSSPRARVGCFNGGINRNTRHVDQRRDRCRRATIALVDVESQHRGRSDAAWTPTSPRKIPKGSAQATRACLEAAIVWCSPSPGARRQAPARSEDDL